MFLKIHRSPGSGDVVAVCDRELINRTISNETVTVTASVMEAFYGNSPATADEVRAALKRTGNANLMGERAVSIAISMGLLTHSECIMIDTVPHAQIYQL